MMHFWSSNLTDSTKSQKHQESEKKSINVDCRSPLNPGLKSQKHDWYIPI